MTNEMDAGILERVAIVTTEALMPIELSLDFKLEKWKRRALQKVSCYGCFGVGADRYEQSRACAMCKGTGTCEREPHVIELIDLVRQLTQAADVTEKAKAEAVSSHRAALTDASRAAIGEQAARSEAERLWQDLNRATNEADALAAEVERTKVTLADARERLEHEQQAARAKSEELAKEHQKGWDACAKNVASWLDEVDAPPLFKYRIKQAMKYADDMF